MSHNPYGAPAAPAAETSRVPAALAGRILAPLLVPLLLVPVVIGVVTTLVQGNDASLLGETILNFAPVTVLAMMFVSPVSMLVLLPFRYLPWLRRGLLATAVQLLLMLALGGALYLYFGTGPVEVQLPRRAG